MKEEEGREEKIRKIVSRLDRDVEMPPYDSNSGRGYSKDYKNYREEEKRQQELNRYEKLCRKSASILNIKSDEATREKLNPPLRLLGWEISPGMVVSAAMLVGFSSLIAWGLLFGLNSVFPIIPSEIILLLFLVPPLAGFYTYYKPIYDAQSKVVESSGEMILSIIYMVIYLRSSPNLEGAIRFAALNLEGPISDDLKGVLWDLEVGNFSTIEESLENYTRVWKDYNDDYLESLQLLRASINEPSERRREDLLQNAVDRMLDGTREKMKHYAQSLKTPVMILNAMGAMLPVLGMIMLPLISVFMGGAITPVHLFMMFNMILPVTLYWFMKRILNSRPPAVASKASDVGELPERGRFTAEVLGREISLPAWPVGLAIFVVVSLYGFAGYATFPEVYPLGSEALESAPSLFVSGEDFAPFPMLMRSTTITLGLGLGLGVYKVLGNRERRDAEKEIEKIEDQFPAALFQLGNKISSGEPAEMALSDAAEATSDMEISGLFERASRNVNQMGMTFGEALFHEKYGAVRFYPSKMIETVMKAILQSSEKGTRMAAEAMMTISNYLQNIHQTQERLNDLLEETTTTIKMLSFLLAPVISGVAVGMSQTIITAMFKLSQSFQGTRESLPSSGTGQATQFSGILGNLESAIPPEVLQMVVGIYLVQLLYILGAFHTKITKGEDATAKNMFTGKILISGIVFYSITMIIVTLLFGGMVDGLAASQ